MSDERARRLYVPATLLMWAYFVGILIGIGFGCWFGHWVWR